MRNRMIAGNWKMNKTYVEGVELAQGLADQLADGTDDVDVAGDRKSTRLNSSHP